MTPFPTMREIFAVGWGNPDVREQWKTADSPQRRAVLLQEANSRPYEPDPQRTHAPVRPTGPSGTAAPRTSAACTRPFSTTPSAPAAPVRDIMSEIPGIDLDRAEWPYIGAKAGNLPGDLTFSWYAVDRTGQAWVVSFQLNWPRYHSPNAGGWVMTIIKQVFAMLPRYR